MSESKTDRVVIPFPTTKDDAERGLSTFKSYIQAASAVEEYRQKQRESRK